MMFEEILQAQTPRDMIGFTLDDHIELGTNLFKVSVPAVEVILAALAGEASLIARQHLLNTLWRISGGESDATEVSHGRAHLEDECRARVREGLWVVAQVGMNETADEADEAADILAWSEIHEVRSKFYQDLLRRRAVLKTKRKC